MLCRELTEPECDRDLYSKKMSWLQQMMRGEEKMAGEEGEGVEDITGEQLQQELDQIIREYKEKKQQESHKQNKEVPPNKHKFIISV